MINQSMQQKLFQKLSPQQIQIVKLLEIPTMFLDERIKSELEENPLLEEGTNNIDGEMSDAERDDTNMSIDEYLNMDDTPQYKLNAKNYAKDEQKTEIPLSAGNSFHEQLETQLGLRNVSERQYFLVNYLIGCIDDDGYLRRKLDAIADDLAFSQGIETNKKELETALKIVQEFDPPGVGARNLKECLILQLKQKKETSEIALAIKILNNCFSEFTKKHFDKIIIKMAVSEDEIKGAVYEILKLNPKPGSSFQSDKVAEHIIPDFILEYRDGEMQLGLNSRNVPDLRISNAYSDMLESYSKNRRENKHNKDAVNFVKQKLDSAKWFIDAIKQRQSTMMTTMKAIMQHQHEYFDSWGDELLMKPMILKDIEALTGLDISTISRVANSKYIQTPFGIFPLKFFFSEGLLTESGDEVSAHEVRKIVKDCVEGESKRRPLTDDELSDILHKKGYLIARRTVAKYREQLNIPVARMRKEL